MQISPETTPCCTSPILMPSAPLHIWTQATGKHRSCTWYHRFASLTRRTHVNELNSTLTTAVILFSAHYHSANVSFVTCAANASNEYVFCATQHNKLRHEGEADQGPESGRKILIFAWWNQVSVVLVMKSNCVIYCSHLSSLARYKQWHNITVQRWFKPFCIYLMFFPDNSIKSTPFLAVKQFTLLSLLGLLHGGVLHSAGELNRWGLLIISSYNAEVKLML